MKKKRIVCVLSFAIAAVLFAAVFSGCEKNLESNYNSIVPYELGFIAVGDGGVIDIIDADGTKTRLDSGVRADLNDAVCENGTVVIVGDNGTVLTTYDGSRFVLHKSGTKKDLNAVVFYNERYIAAGDDGILIYGSGGNTWDKITPVYSADIEAMDKCERFCAATTSDSKILLTTDGLTWELFDYNSFYTKSVDITAIASAGELMYIAGVQNGSPLLLYSSSGRVWTERLLNYIEGTETQLLGLEICDMAWDGRQIVAVSEDGRVISVPECVECNKLETVEGLTGELSAIGVNGCKLVIIGDNNYIDIRDNDYISEKTVTADKVLEMQQQGAVIIDVRAAAEYKQKHIKGSINIPLSALTSRIYTQCPDKNTPIVFYCSKGIRSGAALENISLLGYTNVYNLGSIDNWTYEFE